MNESSRWTEEEMETAKKGNADSTFLPVTARRFVRPAVRCWNTHRLINECQQTQRTVWKRRRLMRVWLPVERGGSCHVLLGCVCACISESARKASVALWSRFPFSVGQGSLPFIWEVVKSVPYQSAPANTAVINSGCLLSLTEDYPKAYGWFAEVTAILLGTSSLYDCLGEDLICTLVESQLLIDWV